MRAVWTLSAPDHSAGGFPPLLWGLSRSSNPGSAEAEPNRRTEASNARCIGSLRAGSGKARYWLAGEAPSVTPGGLLQTKARSNINRKYVQSLRDYDLLQHLLSVTVVFAAAVAPPSTVIFAGLLG